jgi:hypothetical protein
VAHRRFLNAEADFGVRRFRIDPTGLEVQAATHRQIRNGCILRLQAALAFCLVEHGRSPRFLVELEVEQKKGPSLDVLALFEGELGRSNEVRCGAVEGPPFGGADVGLIDTGVLFHIIDIGRRAPDRDASRDGAECTSHSASMMRWLELS